MDKVNKEVARISKENRELDEAKNNQVNEDKELSKRIADQVKKESDFNKERDSFIAYRDKILKAINENKWPLNKEV